MSNLLILFIFGFIGLSLRFIIIGEFELDQLFLLLLFPIASILVYFIMKWQYNKDCNYEPRMGERDLVTRLGDRVSTTKKKMYHGKKLIGTYQRFYNRWWKRVVADIMNNPGLWYLNLTFSLSNGEEIVFKKKNETKIRGNNEWIIYLNNEGIGTVKTDYSLKNIGKLKESLYLEYKGNTYHYQSSSIRSVTEISVRGSKIATGERVSGSVYELTVNDSHEKEAQMLFMVYILFNYEFGQ
ncbi:tubby C-terminal domain-like protein [Gracilibacillus dipsosauri]|uniref:tubby C-terminal domain-like protein n=1 Tax=Gracilibacillus dipsosauri TaxID=178340 RepID=UPI00240A50C8